MSRYQVKRSDLTDDQWAYIKGVIFPTMNTLKAIARERMQKRKAGEPVGADEQ